MIKIFLFLFVIFFFAATQQTHASPDTQSFMDSGKFFVVVSVLSTILIGIFALLIFLERKISKLERYFSK